MSPCQLWQVESVTFLRDMIVIAKAADAAWKNEQHGVSALLGGGFKDFLFSLLLGEVIQFD